MRWLLPWVLAVAEDWDQADPLQWLTPGNWGKLVGGAPEAVVLFYLPWDAASQELLPVLRSVGRSKAKAVAVVDCDDQRAIAERSGIRTFPTLRTYARGEARGDYAGAWTAKAIHVFLLRRGR
mmetsp:Transcript_88068/g.201273  ORF Transcript_88068/g.201273 Transcript_88068/m.201273 type:complete len:123 (-) Transcript_88068:155-523(-)